MDDVQFVQGYLSFLLFRDDARKKSDYPVVISPEFSPQLGNSFLLKITKKKLLHVRMYISMWGSTRGASTSGVRPNIEKPGWGPTKHSIHPQSGGPVVAFVLWISVGFRSEHKCNDTLKKRRKHCVEPTKSRSNGRLLDDTSDPQNAFLASRSRKHRLTKRRTHVVGGARKSGVIVSSYENRSLREGVNHRPPHAPRPKRVGGSRPSRGGNSCDNDTLLAV